MAMPGPRYVHPCHCCTTDKSSTFGAWSPASSADRSRDPWTSSTWCFCTSPGSLGHSYIYICSVSLGDRFLRGNRSATGAFSLHDEAVGTLVLIHGLKLRGPPTECGWLLYDPTWLASPYFVDFSPSKRILRLSQAWTVNGKAAVLSVTKYRLAYGS